MWNKLAKNIKILLWASYFILLALFFKFWSFWFPLLAFPKQPWSIYNEIRESSQFIAFIWIIIVSIIYFVIKLQKSERTKLFLWILTLFVSIFTYLSFYLVNLQYVYEEHSWFFMYKSSDWEYITNKDRYFDLVKKYWFDYSASAKFETLDDAIDALKFADENNIKWLYNRAFLDIERFWYDKAFEKYKDKTFQVYFLYHIDPPVNYRQYFYDNVKYFNSFINNSQDIILTELMELINNKYSGYLNWEITEEELFKFIREETYHNSNLDNLNWVNYKIIY